MFTSKSSGQPNKYEWKYYVHGITGETKAERTSCLKPHSPSCHKASHTQHTKLTATGNQITQTYRVTLNQTNPALLLAFPSLNI